MATHRSRRGAFALLLVLASLCFSLPPSAHALPKRDEPGGDPTCEETWFITGSLLLDGLHLGSAVVRTRPLNIIANTFKINHVGANCRTTLYGLPTGKFSWSLLTRPATSATILSQTSTQIAAITPDLNGTYLVRFTACPSTCTVSGQTIPAQAFDLTFISQERLTLPPATQPAKTPDAPATTPTTMNDTDAKCLGGGGVQDPQWVTVNQWTGPNDYELLEGEVQKSRVSRKDNPLNHDSQDHVTHILPDPLYRRLLRAPQEQLEVEWERDSLPEPFRATPGDRMSAFGFWTLDCGHDAPTEIHPPVGTAVQRARPVPIPSDAIFDLPTFSAPGGAPQAINPTVRSTIGTDVIVPGVITDIWFNAEAGETTGNCSTTGLHQPGRYVSGPNGLTPIQGDCIESPVALNRIFTFNINLPPRPKLQGAYQVPLYTKVFAHPYGFATGADPTIALVGTDDNPVLSVSVNLREFSGLRYARQIHAGWVIPSPDNWELKRWRLRLNAIDVHDDGDSFVRGDGDWRFWLNTNNARSEWTKLYDCDGCVNGRETFSGRPWQTGSPSEVASDRSLGPDILTFPSQRIWVHTSGFEADSVIDDDTGSVNVLWPQQARSYATRSMCTAQTISGCADYTLEYDISAGPPLPTPVLTAAAQRLLGYYGIGPATPGVACLACIDVLANWFVYDLALPPDQPPVDVSQTRLFRAQPSLEVNALTDISMGDFRTTIARLKTRDPALVRKVMGELRTAVNDSLGGGRADEAALDWGPAIAALPDDLRQQYFGDLRLMTVHLPLVGN